MKKESKYLLLLVVAAVIYLGIKIFVPKPHDYNVTFNKDDENPFGGYIMNDLLTDLFPNRKITHSYKTFYETYDSATAPINILSISEGFEIDNEDLKLVLKNVSRGGSIFICAEDFDYKFADTLGIATRNYFWDPDTEYNYYESKDDTTQLYFKNPRLQSKEKYFYPRYNVHQYFSKFNPATSSVIAVNDQDYPITIKVRWGKGYFFLNSTPLAFSNAYLIYGENPDFVAKSLSYLPPRDLIWSEYYQNGRMEASTPLRYILTTEPLKWAYYLTIFSILIFLLFEAKRKQRIIPVIKPLSNTSLEFVSTIANLYFQNGDHKDIAEKKINYFLEFIRSKYWLDTNKITPDFVTMVSRRSGNSVDEVKKLFRLIDSIRTSKEIYPEKVIELNKAIEGFHKNSVS